MRHQNEKRYRSFKQNFAKLSRILRKCVLDVKFDSLPVAIVVHSFFQLHGCIFRKMVNRWGYWIIQIGSHLLDLLSEWSDASANQYDIQDFHSHDLLPLADQREEWQRASHMGQMDSFSPVNMDTNLAQSLYKN